MAVFLTLFYLFLTVFFSVLELNVGLELTCVVHSIVSIALVLKRGEITAHHLLLGSTLNRVWVQNVKRCILQT